MRPYTHRLKQKELGKQTQKPCIFSFFQKAKTYLDGVKVNVDDITSNVFKIRDGNRNNGVFVRNKNYSPVDDDSESCCNYEYFVLNAKCKQMVSYI